MSSTCTACRQANLNNSLKKTCGSCQKIFCSNCVYQRIAIPKLNYQMYEVCTPCFHSISTEMMLQKPPKNFIKRLEQQPPSQQQQKRMPVNELDPETKALEDRLQQLRMAFPSKSTTQSSISNTPDDLIQQMHDELNQMHHENERLMDELRHVSNEYETIKTKVIDYEDQFEGLNSLSFVKVSLIWILLSFICTKFVLLNLMTYFFMTKIQNQMLILICFYHLILHVLFLYFVEQIFWISYVNEILIYLSFHLLIF